MSLKDYKEYFKSNTEEEDEDDAIFLRIESVKNKKDREYEYSIKWNNENNDENGYINSINTSSIFSLNSCSWIYEDDEYDEDS
tara:strand:- start:193 stop:441 length:249 start_codon:yes stop_codon:yes gene_type:complete